MSLYIGMLSGTSMDGIDVALIDCQMNSILHVATYPYSSQMIHSLNAVICENNTVTASQIARLDRELGYAFVKACNKFMHGFSIQNTDVKAIGFHGQTLCHSPFGAPSYTFQAGCPHTVSVGTGVPTVADFRGRDIALGGQGAPLAPLFHNTLFPQRNECVAVVNIGGVANISLLNADGTFTGFDTGPGNTLMDAWIRQHKNRTYDEKGAWGASGQLIPTLLKDCLRLLPSSIQAPFSFDKAQFSLAVLDKCIKKDYPLEDVQATFAHFTVSSIAKAVKEHSSQVKQVYVCGGGAENHFLMQLLTEYLSNCEVRNISALGLDPLFVEAHMFAWLAHMRLKNNQFNLDSITGAKVNQYLGVVYT